MNSTGIYRQLHLRQDAFDLLARRFEPWRQLEMRTQIFECLVDQKSRRVGCDLKEHAARFTKVDGMEVLAVEYRRYVQPCSRQLRLPRALRFVRFGSEGYVVH